MKEKVYEQRGRPVNFAKMRETERLVKLGLSNSEIAKTLNTSIRQVCKWKVLSQRPVDKLPLTLIERKRIMESES